MFLFHAYLAYSIEHRTTSRGKAKKTAKSKEVVMSSEDEGSKTIDVPMTLRYVSTLLL